MAFEHIVIKEWKSIFLNFHKVFKKAPTKVKIVW